MKSDCLIAEIGLIVISDIARGAGGVFYGHRAYVDLGAFYPAGMWVAIILGFVVHLRAKGHWIGMVVGSVHSVVFTMLSRVTGFTNRQKQATKGRERLLEGRQEGRSSVRTD